MKHTLKIILSCTVGLAFFLYVVSSAPLQAAPTGLYFAPGGGGLTQGQEFSVDIYGTAPSNFGAPSTTVVVKYPSNLLSVIETSKAGSAIPDGTLASNPAQQTVSFTNTVFFGVSAGLDNQKLFSIKFRAINPGTATLDFTSNFLAGHTVTKNPSTYTILTPTCPPGQVGTPPNCSTPPPPSCPAGQTGTPPNCSTPPAQTPAPVAPKPATPRPPAASPTPAPTTPDTSPPPVQPEQPQTSITEKFAVDNVKLTTSYDSANLSWATSSQATGELVYGTSVGKLDNTAVVVKDESAQKFSVKFSKLKPGTKYFYTITAAEKDKPPVTEKGSFTTKSYPVLLRISQDGTALTQAKITLKNYRESYTTNDKGEVALTLNPGDYTLVVAKDNLSEEQTFSVKALDFRPGGVPDTQVVSVAIAAVAQGSKPTILPLILGIIALLLTLGGIVAVILWKKRQSQANSLGYQSMIEDTPLQSAATPAYDATYTTPAYYEQSNFTPPTQQQNTTPMAQYGPAPTFEQPYAQAAPNTIISEPEPQDMWSSSPYTYPATPATAEPPATAPDTLSQSSPTPEQVQAVYTQTYGQVAPTPTASEAAFADTPAAPLSSQPASPLVETPAAPTLEGAYELGDDDGLTIHHSS